MTFEEINFEQIKLCPNFRQVPTHPPPPITLTMNKFMNLDEIMNKYRLKRAYTDLKTSGQITSARMD